MSYNIPRRNLQMAHWKDLLRLANFLELQTYPNLEVYDRRVLIIRQLDARGLVE